MHQNKRHGPVPYHQQVVGHIPIFVAYPVGKGYEAWHKQHETGIKHSNMSETKCMAPGLLSTWYASQ